MPVHHPVDGAFSNLALQYGFKDRLNPAHGQNASALGPLSKLGEELTFLHNRRSKMPHRKVTSFPSYIQRIDL